MRREFHVRFCEGVGVQFPRATRLNVYVRSKRAGEDAMQLLRKLYGQLRLRINEAKSAVDRPWNRKFLGYSFWVAPGKLVKLKVAPKALEAMKGRIREITDRNGGRSMTTVFGELRSYLPGWKEYFRLAATPGVFRGLDEWIRHRLRMVQLKQWKRRKTALRALLKLGVPAWLAEQAATNRSWWRNACKALNNALSTSYYDRMGVPRLAS